MRSLFPFGTTTVSYTATDAAGNAAGCSFDVTVADTTPPVPACPADITLEGTGPAGEVVAYAPTAGDLCDPSPSVVSVPPSGSFFPRGVTMVTCTAIDASGNQTLGTFPVIVRPSIRPGSL